MNDLIEPVISVLALITFSLIMRFVLELCKQSWITTFSHTVTKVFLPVITFFVTKVISGDIAKFISCPTSRFSKYSRGIQLTKLI